MYLSCIPLNNTSKYRGSLAKDAPKIIKNIVLYCLVSFRLCKYFSILSQFIGDQSKMVKMKICKIPPLLFRSL